MADESPALFGDDAARRIIRVARRAERMTASPAAARPVANPAAPIWGHVKPTAEQTGYWDGVLMIPASDGTLTEGDTIKIYSAVDGEEPRLDTPYPARFAGVDANAVGVWIARFGGGQRIRVVTCVAFRVAGSSGSSGG